MLVAVTAHPGSAQANLSPRGTCGGQIIDAKDYPAPRDHHPSVYPGERPGNSYLLEGSKVRLIEFVKPGDIHSARIHLDDCTPVGLDLRLRQLGVMPLADRIAVIGYGSNRNPSQILIKWRHARQKGSHVQDVVPVLKGTLDNVDVVVEQFTSYGTVYAGILEGPQTKGQVTEAWLTLLDPDQLIAMNESEDVHRKDPAYKLAVFPGYTIEGFRKKICALGYAGNSKIFKSKTHKSPIVFSTVVSEGRKLNEYDAVGALELILREGDLTREVLSEAGAKSVPELMSWMNNEWNKDQDSGKTSDPDIAYKILAAKIHDYIDKSSSMELKLADELKTRHRLIPVQEIDNPSADFKLGNLLRKCPRKPPASRKQSSR